MDTWTVQYGHESDGQIKQLVCASAGVYSAEASLESTINEKIFT